MAGGGWRFCIAYSVSAIRYYYLLMGAVGGEGSEKCKTEK